MPVTTIIDDAALFRGLSTRLRAFLPTTESTLAIVYMDEMPTTPANTAVVRIVSVSIDGEPHTSSHEVHLCSWKATLSITFGAAQESIYAASSAVSAVRNGLEGHRFVDGSEHEFMVTRIATEVAGLDGADAPVVSGSIVVEGTGLRTANATRGGYVKGS